MNHGLQRLTAFPLSLRLIREIHAELMCGRAPDEVYAEARKEFGEEELLNLSLAIITING